MRTSPVHPVNLALLTIPQHYLPIMSKHNCLENRTSLFGKIQHWLFLRVNVGDDADSTVSVEFFSTLIVKKRKQHWKLVQLNTGVQERKVNTECWEQLNILLTVFPIITLLSVYEIHEKLIFMPACMIRAIGHVCRLPGKHYCTHFWIFCFLQSQRSEFCSRPIYNR